MATFEKTANPELLDPQLKELQAELRRLPVHRLEPFCRVHGLNLEISLPTGVPGDTTSHPSTLEYKLSSGSASPLLLLEGEMSALYLPAYLKRGRLFSVKNAPEAFELHPLVEEIVKSITLIEHTVLSDRTNWLAEVAALKHDQITPNPALDQALLLIQQYPAFETVDTAWQIHGNAAAAWFYKIIYQEIARQTLFSSPSLTLLLEKEFVTFDPMHPQDRPPQKDPSREIVQLLTEVSEALREQMTTLAIKIQQALLEARRVADEKKPPTTPSGSTPYR